MSRLEDDPISTSLFNCGTAWVPKDFATLFISDLKSHRVPNFVHSIIFKRFAPNLNFQENNGVNFEIVG